MTPKIREQFNQKQPKMKHVVKQVPKFDWLNGRNQMISKKKALEMIDVIANIFQTQSVN